MTFRVLIVNGHSPVTLDDMGCRDQPSHLHRPNRSRCLAGSFHLHHGAPDLRVQIVPRGYGSGGWGQAYRGDGGWQSYRGRGGLRGGDGLGRGNRLRCRRGLRGGGGLGSSSWLSRGSRLRGRDGLGRGGGLESRGRLGGGVGLEGRGGLGGGGGGAFQLGQTVPVLSDGFIELLQFNESQVAECPGGCSDGQEQNGQEYLQQGRVGRNA